MKVYTLKLVNGDELIARYDESADEYCDIRMVQVIPISQNDYKAILTNYLVTASMDARVKIDPSKIMIRTEPKDDFEKGYLQEVSGLVLR